MTVAAADSLHTPMANALRVLAMDAVQKANSGHPGMPMGMADVATVLWRHYLRFDPLRPDWADRDRFILSGGHGSMLLYALAHVTGYTKMSMNEIKNFRQHKSHTPGHPERDIDAAIEMTTGPLGQGIASSVGFALAERILNARFGDELTDHRTFVFAGDGDMMEGLSHEACSLAAHMKLGRLVVYYDDNQISIDGRTDISFTEDVAARFEAYGWHVQKIDGHNPQAIADATDKALAVTDKPSLIACRTIIGYGAPNKQNTSGCHGSPLGAEEVAAARAKLGWTLPPFELPEDIAAAWRTAGARNAQERIDWEDRLANAEKKELFTAAIHGVLPQAVEKALAELKQKIADEKPKVATRQSSGAVLAALLPVLPELIGGSADLTPSNNTSVQGFGAITAPDYKGSYIH
ncbi:MAG: transketolase, partial [Bdellovibrionales bacterium]